MCDFDKNNNYIGQLKIPGEKQNTRSKNENTRKLLFLFENKSCSEFSITISNCGAG